MYTMFVLKVFFVTVTSCLLCQTNGTTYSNIWSKEVLAQNSIVEKSFSDKYQNKLPLVINTWNITKAAYGAWGALTKDGLSAVDAVVDGCSLCEDGSCLPSIGIGGSPDEYGETTLDAMIMDGHTMDAGSVGNLREIENAIKVAHDVMTYTRHTLLVGELATDFAISMGFKRKSLQTNSSYDIWKKWKDDKCQPNFWQNVKPDPRSNCGPYRPDSSLYTDNSKLSETRGMSSRYNKHVDNIHHDTIGMVVIDGEGHVAAGTSTNGANHKIPGRVGDSPIVGAGAYAEDGVGGAAATGDGDVMMRFLPSFHAVQLMSQGYHPATAAQIAIGRMRKHYPEISAALIAVSVAGVHGGGCMGFERFTYNIIDNSTRHVNTISVTCNH